jgi:hypothetical protein
MFFRKINEKWECCTELNYPDGFTLCKETKDEPRDGWEWHDESPIPIEDAE